MEKAAQSKQTRRAEPKKRLEEQRLKIVALEERADIRKQKIYHAMYWFTRGGKHRIDIYYAAMDTDLDTVAYGDIVNFIEQPEYIGSMQELTNLIGDPTMFSQQHYVAMANLLKQHKLAATSDSELKAIGDLQMSIMKLFKQDNPKFKDLIFVGACGAAPEKPA